MDAGHRTLSSNRMSAMAPSMRTDVLGSVVRLVSRTPGRLAAANDLAGTGGAAAPASGTSTAACASTLLTTESPTLIVPSSFFPTCGVMRASPAPGRSSSSVDGACVSVLIVGSLSVSVRGEASEVEIAVDRLGDHVPDRREQRDEQHLREAGEDDDEPEAEPDDRSQCGTGGHGDSLPRHGCRRS